MALSHVSSLDDQQNASTDLVALLKFQHLFGLAIALSRKKNNHSKYSYFGFFRQALRISATELVITG
jgi:hypothetical protein